MSHSSQEPDRDAHERYDQSQNTHTFEHNGQQALGQQEQQFHAQEEQHPLLPASHDPSSYFWSTHATQDAQPVPQLRYPDHESSGINHPYRIHPNNVLSSESSQYGLNSIAAPQSHFAPEQIQITGYNPADGSAPYVDRSVALGVHQDSNLSGGYYLGGPVQDPSQFDSPIERASTSPSLENSQSSQVTFTNPLSSSSASFRGYRKVVGHQDGLPVYEFKLGKGYVIDDNDQVQRYAVRQ